MISLLNPRTLLAIALCCALAASHWWAYSKGKQTIQARWDAQIAAERAALVDEAQKDAEATVKVVTEYVDRERIVYRDRPVIRDRVVELCKSESDSGLPDRAGDSDALAAQLTFDAFIDEIPHCVSNSNQLEALQQFIRERWQ